MEEHVRLAPFHISFKLHSGNGLYPSLPILDAMNSDDLYIIQCFMLMKNLAILR
jgi:hypothetical protein